MTTVGSLAAALDSSAAGLGLDLGGVLTDDADPLRSAGVASTVAGRKPCWVVIGSESRWFNVTGWWQGVELLSGSTTDLGELARAAEAWRRGAKLREIQEVAPFIEVKELTEAHERGPAEAVAVRWRLVLEDLRHEADQSEHARSTLRIAEAAYADPGLRQLYPFTSHWSLHFSTCTGYPFSWDVPFVAPLSDARYRVCGPPRGTVIGEADTAEEAVAMAVDGLPANCGPAVAGTADDRHRG